MSLAFGNTGEKYSIQNICGNPRMRQYLYKLGFMPGQTIEIVNKNGANVIVSVMGTRVALSFSVANKIHI